MAVEKILEGFQTASRDWTTAVKNARTDVEKQEARRLRPDASVQVARLTQFAAEHPDHPAAVTALVGALNLLSREPEANRNAMETALEQLRVKWAAHPAVAPIFPRVKLYAHCKNYERFLRDVIEKNPARQARAHAEYALAERLKNLCHLPAIYAEGAESQARLEKTLGKEWLELLLKRDPIRLETEWQELAEHVVTEYGDVPWWSGKLAERAVNNKPLAVFATELLEQAREVGVGKPAPDIVGEDIDGKTIRLSDYRGKVVVIVAWASWCGPCMKMLPHEQALVAKYKNDPFALIGINLVSLVRSSA